MAGSQGACARPRRREEDFDENRTSTSASSRSVVTLEEVAAALSSPTRTAILRAARSNMPFSEIAEVVGITPQTLTYHVEVLADAGLVVVDRTGTRKYLRLPFDRLLLPLR